MVFTLGGMHMPPESSRRTAFPSVLQAALLLLAGFLLQYLIGIALYDFRNVLGLASEQLMVIGTVLSYGVLIAAVMQFLNIGYRDLLHPSKASPAVTFALLAPPVLMLLPLIVLLDTSLIGVLETVFPVSAWEQRAFESMVAPTLAAFVATCVIAPVVEEMLFRGILLRAFLQQYPRGAAIGYSALFFGAAHLNVYQFVLAFWVGLLLGWLYERSRSLVPCIVLHAAVNLTAMLSGAGSDSAAGVDLSSVSPAGWLAAAAAAGVGVLVLRRLLARRVPQATDAV